MSTWVVRLLATGMPELFDEFFAGLRRRWPDAPWRSAAIEVQSIPEGFSYRHVYGADKRPITREAAEASALPITVLLPHAQVLHHVLTLPALPLTDMRAALTHEISRHSPFSAEQVSFTWRVLSRHAETGSQQVALWVLPLTTWQREVARIGLPLARIRGVDVRDGHGLPTGINLLPLEARAVSVQPQVRGWAWFALGLSLLMLLALYGITQNRKADVQRWREQVEAMREQVRPVRALKAELTRRTQQHQFLVGIHQRTPSRVQLLDALTRCLPETTVLDRLSISGQVLALEGVAPSPEALIPALACVPELRNPRLIGTLQAEAAGQNQRFSIQADLGKGRTQP